MLSPCTRAEPLVVQQVATKRVLQALRLLEDLLQHEVIEAIPLDRRQVPLDLVDRLVDEVRLEVPDAIAVTAQHRELAIVEVHHRAGVLQQRRRIGGDEELALAHAHEQRGSLAGRHQYARLVGRDECKAVRAVDVAQGRCDRFLEVARIELAHQVREHLGVGLRLEDVTPALERLPDVSGVLDDAVMDDRDPARLVGVRMRIRRGGRAVRGPAGVADTQRAGGRGTLQPLLEHAQLARRLHHLDTVTIHDREAGRVVAAVLHAAQSVDDQARRLAGADIPYDATHRSLLVNHLLRSAHQ
jgi:hypothetical protein